MDKTTRAASTCRALLSWSGPSLTHLWSTVTKATNGYLVGAWQMAGQRWGHAELGAGRGPLTLSGLTRTHLPLQGSNLVDIVKVLKAVTGKPKGKRTQHSGPRASLPSLSCLWVPLQGQGWRRPLSHHLGTHHPFLCADTDAPTPCAPVHRWPLHPVGTLGPGWS